MQIIKIYLNLTFYLSSLIVLINQVEYNACFDLNLSKCGFPGQSWDGGNVILISPEIKEYELVDVNETVSYGCSAGRMYVEDDGKQKRIKKSGKTNLKEYVRSCQSDGEWNGALPKCGMQIKKTSFNYF
jgi:hypothetical protein